MTWTPEPNVHFALAIFAAPRQAMSGWSCSIHGVEGFAVHRAPERHLWRVSHVATGRLVPGSEADSREAAIRGAEREVGAKACAKGYSHDVGRFLRSCIWHEAEGVRNYEEAIAEAEGVRS